MTFTPEDLAAAIHDNNGAVKQQDTTQAVKGFDTRGLPTTDTTSVNCLARIATQNLQTTYFIATNKQGGLFIPQGAVDFRSGWIECNQEIFERYVTCLRSGNTFGYSAIKDELRIS